MGEAWGKAAESPDDGEHVEILPHIIPTRFMPPECGHDLCFPHPPHAYYMYEIPLSFFQHERVMKIMTNLKENPCPLQSNCSHLS